AGDFVLEQKIEAVGGLSNRLQNGRRSPGGFRHDFRQQKGEGFHQHRDARGVGARKADAELMNEFVKTNETLLAVPRRRRLYIRTTVLADARSLSAHFFQELRMTQCRRRRSDGRGCRWLDVGGGDRWSLRRNSSSIHQRRALSGGEKVADMF